MDLVIVHLQSILHSSNVTSDLNQPTEELDIHSLTEEEILSKYADLFKGLGKMNGKLHLDVDNSMVPEVMPPQHVPIAMKVKLRQTLF